MNNTTTISKLHACAQRQLDRFTPETEIQILATSKWLTVYKHEHYEFAVDSENSVFEKDDYELWDDFLRNYGFDPENYARLDSSGLLPEPIIYLWCGESQGVATTYDEAVRFIEHDNSFVESRVVDIDEETGLPEWAIYVKPHQRPGDTLREGYESEAEAWKDVYDNYSYSGYTGGDNYRFETIASLQDELSQLIDDENEDQINEVKDNIKELQAAIDERGKA
jgi:hypothetical protein